MWRTALRAVAALTAGVAVWASEPGPRCQAYLQGKGLASPQALADELATKQFGAKCTPAPETSRSYAPDPTPSVPGATDTTDLACRHGNPAVTQSPTCCGWRPHFNWVVSTCEPNDKLSTSMFCKVPTCVKEGSPKINYVAAYQYNGSHFVLLEDSTAGDVSPEGVAGNYHEGTGWERRKADFDWLGGAGDWTSKYAPWGEGPSGPRGVTPPGALYVLSAENFYYAGFYMLSQLNLNLQGAGNPTGNPCWVWEFDPVEGTMGWFPEGTSLPGNLNQLYATNNAAPSGCMPVAYTAHIANGGQRNFSVPSEFASYCAEHPEATGCEPWAAGQQDLWWSGTVHGTQRFENLWDEPYVFAVLIDRRGVWIYRWRPDPATGTTGWPGVERHSAARVLGPRPNPVTDPAGLVTDVPGDAREALILQPSLPPEAACLASSIQEVNWQFGANALGAMAAETGTNAPGQALEGAQNWWSNFADTEQQAGYPLSIAGQPAATLAGRTYDCNSPGTFSCQCAQGGAALNASLAGARASKSVPFPLRGMAAPAEPHRDQTKQAGHIAMAGQGGGGDTAAARHACPAVLLSVFLYALFGSVAGAAGTPQ